MGTFFIGDIVELRSGGPLMTVTGYAEKSSGESDSGELDDAYPVCTWFDTDLRRQTAAFPEAALDEGFRTDQLEFEINDDEDGEAETDTILDEELDDN